MEIIRLNNPASMSRLSGNRKPQIRFLGNRHSGGVETAVIFPLECMHTSFDVNTL